MSTVSPNKRTTVMCVVVAALITAGAGLWFWNFRLDVSGHRADPRDARQVALGEAVYHTHCAACHGAKLEGQPNWRVRNSDGKLPAPPHDETGHTWHHADDQLFRLTKMGVKPPLVPEGYESNMPAFGDTLTDAQIWAVLSFIKSRWPDDIRDRQERINQAVRRREAE